MKILQDICEETNDLQRRIYQLIQVHETREIVNEKHKAYQEQMKQLFDKRAKERTFQPNDLVLKWDKRREEPSKHGQFDSLWCKPFIIDNIEGENAFSLKNIQGESLGVSVNGRFLKHFTIY
jgi:hypothetical protein